MTPEHKDLIETLERLMAEEREALRDSVASWKAYDASRRGKEAYRRNVDEETHTKKRSEFILKTIEALPTLLALIKSGERDRKALEQLRTMTGAGILVPQDGAHIAGCGFYSWAANSLELAEYLRERAPASPPKGEQEEGR